MERIAVPAARQEEATNWPGTMPWVEGTVMSWVPEVTAASTDVLGATVLLNRAPAGSSFATVVAALMVTLASLSLAIVVMGAMPLPATLMPACRWYMESGVARVEPLPLMTRVCVSIRSWVKTTVEGAALASTLLEIFTMAGLPLSPATVALGATAGMIAEITVSFPNPGPSTVIPASRPATVGFPARSKVCISTPSSLVNCITCGLHMRVKNMGAGLVFTATWALTTTEVASTSSTTVPGGTPGPSTPMPARKSATPPR